MNFTNTEKSVGVGSLIFLVFSMVVLLMVTYYTSNEKNLDTLARKKRMRKFLMVGSIILLIATLASFAGAAKYYMDNRASGFSSSEYY